MEMKIKELFLNKKQWAIILLIGVLLLIITIPTSDEQTDTVYQENHDQLEYRLQETLMRMQHVGEVHVMITYQEDESVEGIVILAEGASNATVVKEITEVVQALFDVEMHKIKVIEGISIQ